MKRFLAYLLTGVTVLTNTLTAFASDVSMPSAIVTSYDYEVDENDDSIEDVYYEENMPSENTSTVFAQLGSSYTVAIPKIIVLDGNEKKADYYVAVKGDFAGTEYIQVVTEPSFWLYDVSGVKDPEKAFNERPKQIFVSTNLETVPEEAVNGVNPDEYIKSYGKITAPTITAGRWHSQVNFYVGLFDDFTNIVPVASDGTILQLSAQNINIGEEFEGYKDSKVVLSNALKTNLLEDENKDILETNLTRVLGDTITDVDTDLLLTELYENAKEVEENKEIIYETNSDVIKVTSDGRLYLDGAVAGDTATVTATYKGVANSLVPGVNDRDDIKTSFDVTVYRIDLSEDEVHLDVGDRTQITASIYPKTVKEDIAWKVPEMMDGVYFMSSDNTISNETTMTIEVSNEAIDDNNGELVAAVKNEYSESARIVINPKHVHEYKITAQADPTCEEKGYKTYTCTLCDADTDGHTYTEYEPELGHVASDGHWCDRCDKLIYPYHKGDLIRKTVNGQSILFGCVADDYVTENGQKGAYFMSIDLMPNVKFDNNTSIWANSSLRKLLNGSNSDTKHVSLINTTTHTRIVKPIEGMYPVYDPTVMNNYNASASTDYYFVPSVEELTTFREYAYTPWRDGQNYYRDNGFFGYWLRTPGSDNSAISFTYTDGYMITQNSVNGWFTGLSNGARVAFMVEQEVGQKEESKVWELGDVVYRTINGKQVKFTCANAHYRDSSNEDVGALFIAEELFGASDTIYDNMSNVWATSNLREYMNTNFDTTGLLQVNTTVKTGAIDEGRKSWLMIQSFYKPYLHPDYEIRDNMLPTDDSISPDTYDYYFILSIEEAVQYSNFMLSSNGQIRDLNKQFAQDKYGVALRNPVLADTERICYVATDAKYYNILTDKKVYDNTIGYRPCFVLPHEK